MMRAKAQHMADMGNTRGSLSHNRTFHGNTNIPVPRADVEKQKTVKGSSKFQGTSNAQGSQESRWLHATGVLPSSEGAHVGKVLKRGNTMLVYQRCWCTSATPVYLTVFPGFSFRNRKRLA